MNQKQVSALQSKKTVFLYWRKIPVFAIAIISNILITRSVSERNGA